MQPVVATNAAPSHHCGDASEAGGETAGLVLVPAPHSSPLLVRAPQQNRIEKQLIEDRRTQTRSFRQLSVLQIISSSSTSLHHPAAVTYRGTAPAPGRARGPPPAGRGGPAWCRGHWSHWSPHTVSGHRVCSLIMELCHCVTLCTVYCVCVDCARTRARLPGAAVPVQYCAVQCTTVHSTHTSMHMLQHAPHTELQPAVIG